MGYLAIEAGFLNYCSLRSAQLNDRHMYQNHLSDRLLGLKIRNIAVKYLFFRSLRDSEGMACALA